MTEEQAGESQTYSKVKIGFDTIDTCDEELQSMYIIPQVMRNLTIEQKLSVLRYLINKYERESVGSTTQRINK